MLQICGPTKRFQQAQKLENTGQKTVRGEEKETANKHQFLRCDLAKGRGKQAGSQRAPRGLIEKVLYFENSRNLRIFESARIISKRNRGHIYQSSWISSEKIQPQSVFYTSKLKGYNITFKPNFHK